MAISNFKIPTGLEVSGTDGLQLTGTLSLAAGKILGLSSDVSASAVSASVGRFGDLNVASLTAPSLTLEGDLTVSGTTNLGNQPTDLVYVNGQLTASAGLQVSASNLTVLGNISGSGTLHAGGAATLAGGLTVTGSALDAGAVDVSASYLKVTNDISARSASLGGDLTVDGNLWVKGTTTYVDSTTVNIGDRNVSLATGSTTLAGLDGAGIDLGNAAQVQWYYDHDVASWTANVGLSSSVKVLAPQGDFTTLTGSTVTGTLATFDTVSASVGLSGALGQFTQVTASAISASTSVAAPAIAALGFGTARASVSLTTGTPTVIDTYDPSTLYHSVKYIISAKDSSTNYTHVMEVLVTCDGTTVQHTPYASTYTNTPLFSISTSYAGGVIVTATRTVSNTVVLKVLALTA